MKYIYFQRIRLLKNKIAAELRIFKKLHLILLSKMEVQTENGDKNYQLTHSQTFTNLLVVLP